MNLLKRYLGWLWIFAGLAAAYFNLLVMGIPKLYSGKPDDLVFALINIFILTPLISGGLLIFGVLAIKGNYSEKE